MQYFANYALTQLTIEELERQRAHANSNALNASYRY